MSAVNVTAASDDDIPRPNKYEHCYLIDQTVVASLISHYTQVQNLNSVARLANDLYNGCDSIMASPRLGPAIACTFTSSS